MHLSNSDISRRQFIATAGVAATVACLPTRRIFAAAGGIVDSFRAGGAKAKIDVQKLRDNLSVLIGSGGNIAVLDGADGKLLIDGGLATSQKKLADALAEISDVILGRLAEDPENRRVVHELARDTT